MNTDRCGHCGKFTPWGSDSYIPWGCADPEDPEPYDPVPLCTSCAEATQRRYVAQLLEHGIPCRERRPFYYTPQCWRTAVGIVRGMRKHRLVTSPIRHERVREVYGYMRDEWNGKGTREWCGCGWDTGWNHGSLFGEGSSHEKMSAHIRDAQKSTGRTNWIAA